MPASLKENDWKAMLNKPKNAGLKAGSGTGIGEKLRDVEGALKEYNKDFASEANHKKLVSSYDALKKQCEAVIKKHEKLFTEACTYLKQVKELAVREHEVRSNNAAEVAARRQVRSGLQGLWGELLNTNGGNLEVRRVLAKVLKLFEANKGDWAACAAAETKMRVAMTKIDGIEAGKGCRGTDVDKVFTEMIQKATKE